MSKTKIQKVGADGVPVVVSCYSTERARLCGLNSPSADKKSVPLCYRCEHRAAALETGLRDGPRFECKQADRAVVGCYMYRPVAPLVLAPDKGDKRPFMGPPMLAGRHHAVDVPCVFAIRAQEVEGGVVLYLVPEEKTGKQD